MPPLFARISALTALLAAAGVAQNPGDIPTPYFDDLRIDKSIAAGSALSDTAVTASFGRHVYTAWQDRRHGDGAIYFQRSTDGGMTWLTTDVRRISDLSDPSGATANQWRAQNPAIACVNQNVYVVWEEQRGGQAQIRCNRSTDFGLTWEAASFRIDHAPAGAVPSHPQVCCAADCLLPSICSSATNRVYVVWSDDRNGGRDIFVNYSRGSGALGVDPVTLEPKPELPEGTWQQTDLRVDVTDLPGDADSLYPVISCVPGNAQFGIPVGPDRVHVAWQDLRPAVSPIGFNSVFGLAPRDADSLYGSDLTQGILSIATETGVGSVATPELNLYGLAQDPNTGDVLGLSRVGTLQFLVEYGDTGSGLVFQNAYNAAFGTINGLAFAYDATTGIETLFASEGALIKTITRSGGSALVEVANDSTGVQMTAMAYTLQGLAFDPDYTDAGDPAIRGALYGSDVAQDVLVRIPVYPVAGDTRLRVGAAQAVGPLGGRNIQGLAYDNTLDRLYGVANGTGQDDIVLIDPVTAAVSMLPGNVEGPGIYFAWSDDSADTFSDDVAVHDVSTSAPNYGNVAFGRPQLASATEEAYVVWSDDRRAAAEPDVYFRRFYPLASGQTPAFFDPDIRLDDGDVGQSTAPVLCVKNNCLLSGSCSVPNNVYVAWQDTRGGDSDIYYNVSLVSGDLGSWGASTNQRVDFGPLGSDATAPTIACRTKFLFVAWQDDRNEDVGDLGRDIYFNYSADNGSGLVLNSFDSRLDGVNQPYVPPTQGGPLPPLGPQGDSFSPRLGVSDCGPYAVWLDSRNGQADVRFNVPYGLRPFIHESIDLDPSAMHVSGHGIAAVGGEVIIELANGPANAAVYLIAGFTKNTTLPAPAGPILGPLLISDIPFPFAETLVLDQNGSASYVLTIPGGQSLPGGLLYLGTNLHWQAGHLQYLPSLGVRIVTSNGLELWIG